MLIPDPTCGIVIIVIMVGVGMIVQRLWPHNKDPK